MSKIKRLLQGLVYGLIPITIYLIFGILFNGDHKWMLPLILGSIFLFYYFISSKFDFWKTGILIILPLFLSLLLISFFTGFNLVFLYIIFVPISAFLGSLFYNKKNYLILIFVLVFFPILGYYVLPNQIVLFNNRSARQIKEFKGLTVVNKERDTIQFDKNKIIALDFWTTSCAICFKKFPDFEKIYLKLKSNPDIKMYSVNVPLKRDEFEKTVRLVDSLNYQFPTLFATSMEEARELGVKAYPHLIILKNGKVHYDGRLETEEKIFINNIEDEIKRLIE
ncbi:TlpA disulfide reductase family protein [uncultured Christiangramia sp.]|nr:TlpA disulfide reductase family protein [uncultured Christiangramia sp.]